MNKTIPVLSLVLCLGLGACGDKKKKTSSGGGSPSAATANLDEIDDVNRVVDYEADLDWKNDAYYYQGKPYTGKAKKEKNGVLLGTYTIHEGLLHGPTREYYPSGKISVSTNFREGKRDGANKYFNEDGTTMKAQVYRMDVLIESTDPKELENN